MQTTTRRRVRLKRGTKPGDPYAFLVVMREGSPFAERIKLDEDETLCLLGDAHDVTEIPLGSGDTVATITEGR